METEGPLLETLMHRLSECPADFLADPRASTPGAIDVWAIVCDHLRWLGATAPGGPAPAKFAADVDAAGANRLKLIAVATWLLHDRDLQDLPNVGERTWTLLAEGLDRLAAVTRAETVVSDPDRREELARLCLKHLGLRPRGETIAQAADRLTALDSVERERVIRDTRQAEARAREVRQMMARRAAEEAAAKTSRE